ncbi:hypothetical protein D3874_22150 [Oleomonas cavernae]|uniref:Uncharacterized protein n=1 Tax=Oleomonas cavernae TaxID=2320859 RepID=A0A418WH66_9PROT|nr:hypothetical protein [Oleomonas cavernae]RJF89340.1 hypothetical protein D3874_22150 [Oleomonas cavernae]
MTFVTFTLWDVNGEEEAGPIAVEAGEVAGFHQHGHDEHVTVILLKTAGRAFYVRARFAEVAEQLSVSAATLAGDRVGNG